MNGRQRTFKSRRASRFPRAGVFFAVWLHGALRHRAAGRQTQARPNRGVCLPRAERAGRVLFRCAGSRQTGRFAGATRFRAPSPPRKASAATGHALFPHRRCARATVAAICVPARYTRSSRAVSPRAATSPAFQFFSIAAAGSASPAAAQAAAKSAGSGARNRSVSPVTGCENHISPQCSACRRIPSAK